MGAASAKPVGNHGDNNYAEVLRVPWMTVT